jgi:hypothetical protein
VITIIAPSIGFQLQCPLFIVSTIAKPISLDELIVAKIYTALVDTPKRKLLVGQRG